MLEYIAESAQTLTLIISALALFCAFIALRRRSRQGRIRLKKDASDLWKYHPETEFKRKEAYGAKLDAEAKKSDSKKNELAKAEDTEGKKPIAVITFRGDLKARQHEIFARLVDEVVMNAENLSEVVVRVTSPGGMVSQYGHVLSEMERLRGTNLIVTACVDVVAASGGYLACLPAQKIIAAPFAVVGSVGVVAFVPNFRELLRQYNVEPRTFTAGKYKRTVTLTDEASPEEIARFQAQLESVHRQFRDLVVKYRPQAKMDEIETGEHWTASESQRLDLGLVDELATSSDYLLRANKDRDIIEFSQKRSFIDEGLGQLFSRAFPL